MTTLLSALFSLWLVITILLAALWLLRRYERAGDELDELDPAGGSHEPGDDGANDDAAWIQRLLEGASMPYELHPIADAVADPDRHAVLLSPHSNAEQVGTAFADELVEIGYRIEADGLDRARGVRDDQIIHLQIFPEAGTVRDGAEPRFPGACESDVVIELWAGDDTD